MNQIAQKVAALHARAAFEPTEDAERILDAMISDLVKLRLDAKRLALGPWATTEDMAEYADASRKFIERFGNIVAEHTGDLAGTMIDYTPGGTGDQLRRTSDQAIRDIFHDEIVAEFPDAVMIHEATR